jgi:hypothetical protein
LKKENGKYGICENSVNSFLIFIVTPHAKKKQSLCFGEKNQGGGR